MTAGQERAMKGKAMSENITVGPIQTDEQIQRLTRENQAMQKAGRYLTDTVQRLTRENQELQREVERVASTRDHALSEVGRLGRENDVLKVSMGVAEQALRVALGAAHDAHAKARNSEAPK